MEPYKQCILSEQSEIARTRNFQICKFKTTNNEKNLNIKHFYITLSEIYNDALKTF